MSTPPPTDNETLRVIHAHRSVREYLPTPLPDAVIETIIEAAQRTATSSNLQSWSVVAVTNAERRARLAELCGGQPHVAQAPLFLAWCADLARLDRACHLRGYTQVTDYMENFLVAAMDASLAAQTAALAAESLGLGVCYIGMVRNEPASVVELLQLPHLVFPVTGMTIGWPAATPPLKRRLPLPTVLHREQYDRSRQDELLDEYDRATGGVGIDAERETSAIGAAGRGWLDLAARRASHPERTQLRGALEAQGFGLQ